MDFVTSAFIGGIYIKTLACEVTKRQGIQRQEYKTTVNRYLNLCTQDALWDLNPVQDKEKIRSEHRV